jgi:hypothetical protein
MSDIGIRDYIHAEMLYAKEKDDKEVIPEVTEEFVLAWYKSFWELPEGYYPHLEFCTGVYASSFSCRIYWKKGNNPFGETIRFESMDFFDWSARDFNKEKLYCSMLEFADKVKKTCR